MNHPDPITLHDHVYGFRTSDHVVRCDSCRNAASRLEDERRAIRGLLAEEMREAPAALLAPKVRHRSARLLHTVWACVAAALFLSFLTWFLSNDPGTDIPESNLTDTTEQANEFDPGPSLITLRLKDAPLGQVLEELAKQTPMRFSYKDAPVEDRVTVAFDKTPLFKALDSLCSNHGKIDFIVEDDWDREDWRKITEMRSRNGILADQFSVQRVTVRAVKYGLHPRVIADPFVIQLDSIRMRAGDTELYFSCNWEDGTKPWGAIIQIKELKDDLGDSYAADFRYRGTREDQLEMLIHGAEGTANRSTGATVKRIPDAKATRFTIMKGVVEIVFPEWSEDYSFSDPPNQIGEERKRKSGLVKLLSFSQEKNIVKVSVWIDPIEMDDRLKIVLIGSNKKAYQSTGGGGSGGPVGKGGTTSMEFPLPEGVTPVALSCIVYAGIRLKEIPFTFKDIRIR